MGCIVGKPSAIEDSRESPKVRRPNKESEEARGSRLNSLRREESGDIKLMRIDKKANGSVRVYDEDYRVEKEKRESSDVAVVDHPGMGRIPKASEGEQVAAGWPLWLASVAGEAIKGWIPRRADTFEKLDKIGQGTYSNVYKGRDITSGKLVALKKVRFDHLDAESVKFMAREIIVLRRLDHPNIIKLEGLVTSRKSLSLYLVFEYMEHDLTGLGALPGCKFTEAQIKCYMKQLLSGLDHCHSHGVLHRDIKGSNLLIDNNGILKIADFGLASFFDPHRDFPMTSRVVTLWYRPPELLLGATHYGVSIDLWSTGCILGELYACKPIMPGRTEVEQLHKIFKLCGSPSEDFWRKSNLPHSTVFKPLQPYKRCLVETFKDFPPPAVGLMETLLSIDPAHRGSAASALKSAFFTTKPLACDPSSLPQYPPSKEIDAKLWEEEIRRQGAAGGRGQRIDPEKKVTKDSRAIAEPNANAELAMSMQKRQGQPDPKSRSEMFYRCQEEAASGFPIDLPRRSQAVKETGKKHSDLGHSGRASYSGPLVHAAGWAKAGKKHGDLATTSTRADLATLSGLVATRTSSCEDRREKPGPSKPEPRNQISRFPGSSNDMGKHLNHLTEDSRLVEDEKGCSKEPVPQNHRSREDTMYFSGPLLVTSNNVDQMLKDHDRKVQELDRRARFEKMKVGKYQYQGKQQTRGNPNPNPNPSKYVPSIQRERDR